MYFDGVMLVFLAATYKLAVLDPARAIRTHDSSITRLI